MHGESLSSGQVKITGNGEILSSFIQYEPEIGAGEGTLALFMIDPEYEDEQWWLIQLYTRNGSEYFASVGFSEWYHPYIDIEGKYAEASFRGNRKAPETGVWYYALLAIPSDNEILIRVWERDNPANFSEYTKRLNSEVSGRNWRSAMFSNSGTMYIDSFTVISFP